MLYKGKTYLDSMDVTRSTPKTSGVTICKVLTFTLDLGKRRVALDEAPSTSPGATARAAERCCVVKCLFGVANKRIL